MVARGRGKKAAVAAAASEAVAAVGNGDVPENEVAAETASVAVAAPLPAKKGRSRTNKKEAAKEEEVVEETPPLEVVEKPAKAAKTAKGSKKSAKSKVVPAEVVAAPLEVVKDEKKDAELHEEDDVLPEIETKPAVAEKKVSNRKRKADSTEKAEEQIPAPPVAKKAPKTTKTKAAKKETVDSAGVPENPAVVVAPAVAEAPPQTNGSKKPSTSRKRAAPKVEEPIPEAIKDDEEEEVVAEPEEEEIAPPAPKKSSKSKAPKKESKKTSSKSKGSKKVLKEEDPPEDDVLPEDEFVPELEEEEEEQPLKVKKLVKSKGSRKQLKDDVPPVEEEVASVKEEEAEQVAPEKPDSEVDSVIEEEKQTKGRKPAAKKAPSKKVSAKRTTKAKKAITKDEPELEEEEIKNEESDAADLESTGGKTNGNAKPKAEPAEKKPPRGGRKRTAAVAALAIDDETDGAKSAKPDVLLNPTVTQYEANGFALDKDFKLKISSWNIAGLRSWLKKDGLKYLQYEQPDIFCLQEIKCTPEQLPEEARIPGYHPYWLCMPGGHAGVAVYSKIMPIHVEYGIGSAEHDDAGRIITAEYEKFYLICVYVPNSGRKLVNLEKRMEWEELFRAYVQRLNTIKPVIIAGDMNVAHKEIDLANPKTNTKNAGFTPQERDAMTKLLELGYVDTFRHFYGEQKGAYSFWSYMSKARLKNIGWRLDYFIVSERIISKVVDSTIRPQVNGSDHCPITLFLNI